MSGEPIIPTQTVEMDLGSPIADMTGDPILDELGRNINDFSWVNVTHDVRAIDPISIRRGNFGNTPQDRVANVGTLKLSLDNSAGNLAGIVGYYSPDNINRITEFADGTRVRVAFTYSGKKRYKFQGRVRLRSPESGRWGTLRVPITAEDWMAEAANTPMRGLTVQVNQRDDQLLNTLLGIMDHPPERTDFSTGPDTYALAFHNELGESTMVAAVLQKIALSGMGVIFQVGDDTSGEILRYRNRNDIGALSTPVAVMNNSMVSLQAARDYRKQIKKVIVTFHPSQVDATNTTVLFTLQSEIVIPAGGQASFTCNYKDPNGSRRTSAKDQIIPVAGTDFNFSSSSGAGSDLNGSLQFVSFAPAADQADVVVKNNSGVTGYLWFFRLRGRGIYRYDPLSVILINPNVSTGITLTYDMPYQDIYDKAVAIATALMTFWQTLATDVSQLEFIANRSTTLMDAFLDVEPGTLISVVEDVTGINNLFYVNGIDITSYQQATKVKVIFSLVPAKLVKFFVLDRDGLDTPGPVLGY